MDDIKQNSNSQFPSSNNTNQSSDDAQTVQQNPTQQVSSQTVSQSQTAQTPIKQEEWVLPTGSGRTKEVEPMPSPTATQAEALVPSEPEIQLPQEVAEAGAETVTDMPKLTEEAKKAGVEPAKEATPLPAHVSSSLSQTPLTEEDVKKELTGAPIFKDASRARYWLAMLLQKFFAEKKKEEGKGV